ncbi:MAG: transglycosylase SLT domain-containing protein [Pseudomonadota bacterium]
MIRIIACSALCALVLVSVPQDTCADKVHRHGLTICSIIIVEFTNGRVPFEAAKEMSKAIALAGNRHFGKVTCGDMWLYLAIAQVESNFRSNVVNHFNCRGMFQIHAPSWAHKFGFDHKDLLNPRVNAHVGIAVYKYYLERYGNMALALSAFNSDHPRAAENYVRLVLHMRGKIARRYGALYNTFMEDEPPISQAAKPLDGNAPKPLPEPAEKAPSPTPAPLAGTLLGGA